MVYYVSLAVDRHLAQKIIQVDCSSLKLRRRLNGVNQQQSEIRFELHRNWPWLSNTQVTSFVDFGDITGHMDYTYLQAYQLLTTVVLLWQLRSSTQQGTSSLQVYTRTHVLKWKASDIESTESI